MPEPPAPGPSAATAVPEQDWRRLHPVTPLVRGWGFVAVGSFIILDGVVGMPGPNGVPTPGLEDRDGLTVQVVGLLVLSAVAILFFYLGWLFARYKIDREAVHLHTGVLNRTQRQARLDRLQAVDVVQPLVGRLVGLAELRIEVAGGADSQVRLQYLREAEAQRLRNTLLAAAAGVEYDTEEAPEAPEAPVLAVPPGRLIGATLANGGAVALVLALVALAIAAGIGWLVDGIDPVLLLGAAASAAPGALVIGIASTFGSFARSFNFRLATSPDGLRVRAGLTETRSATIPPGRVQAVQVSQSWLWRPFGWWHVKINVAGYGLAEGAAQTASVLLPVGHREDVLTVLSLVTPDFDEDDVEPVDAGMTGRRTRGGYVHSPLRAAWLDPLAWTRNGYRVTDRALLARSGVLNRVLAVVPHERTQSLGVTQGPVERLLRLATFALHSTPGPVSPRVWHLSTDDAAVLLAEQARRARQARAEAGPERWMTAGSAAGVGLDPLDETVGVPDEHRGAGQPGRGEEVLGGDR